MYIDDGQNWHVIVEEVDDRAGSNDSRPRPRPRIRRPAARHTIRYSDVNVLHRPLLYRQCRVTCSGLFIGQTSVTWRVGRIDYHASSSSSSFILLIKNNKHINAVNITFSSLSRTARINMKHSRLPLKTKARFPLPELTARVHGPSEPRVHFYTRVDGPSWLVSKNAPELTVIMQAVLLSVEINSSNFSQISLKIYSGTKMNLSLNFYSREPQLER